MDANQFREAAHKAIEEIIQYNETLACRKVVSSVQPGYLQPQLPNAAPQDGESWSQIQPDIDRIVIPGLTHWQHPGFMAFFCANTSYPSMLGELYSSALSAPAFNWTCSPVITELETVMLDWLAKMMNLPDAFMSHGRGGGVIQGSASDAVVTAIVVARERILQRLSEGLNEKDAEEKQDSLRGKLVALGSTQAHSATQKGAIIAGTKFRTIHPSYENNYALQGEDVRKALEQCKSDGLVPYYLTISLGTTSTCAVDNFEEIADLIKDYPDIWVHVDAAYAGSALVLPEYQHLTKRLDAFDSFDMNMHKWMLVNFDCSCMYVRTRTDLTKALSIAPPFLKNNFTDSGLVTDYRDWQIPLGRRFRSLKMWFVLRSYGIRAIQEHIRKTIRLGEYFHELAATRPDILTRLTGPSFGLTTISVKSQKLGPVDQSNLHEAINQKKEIIDEENAITKKVYEKVNQQGDIFLTQSSLDGIYVIRVVPASPQADKEIVKKAFEILVQTAQEVLAN